MLTTTCPECSSCYERDTFPMNGERCPGCEAAADRAGRPAMVQGEVGAAWNSAACAILRRVRNHWTGPLGAPLGRLADGFGRGCDPDLWGDWSHYRDSSPAALEAMAALLDERGAA